MGVKINDLYSVVAEDINGNVKEFDNIHLSDKGIELCAQSVAQAIKQFD